MNEFREGYLFALEQVQKQIMRNIERMSGGDYPTCCSATSEGELDALHEDIEEVKNKSGHR